MNRAAEFDPKASPDVCPKCGGKLRFERAQGGTGQTVEICENLRMSTVTPGVNVGSCDHWRTLEILRNPALVRAPRGLQQQPTGHGRVTLRSTGLRAPTTIQMDRIHATLSPHRVEALTIDEVARKLGIAPTNAYRYLELLVSQGRACVGARKTGRPARPPKEYWACQQGAA
jgi:hypothetical protein